MAHLLRLENAALMIVFSVVYFALGFGWKLFAILFLAPDLAFTAYLAGPRVGAWVYNFTHHFGVAGILGLAGWYVGVPLFLAVGLIMVCHIAFDRMLGYGLKHESGFGDTHLGRIGK